jgi:hypothetical protein
MSNTNIRTGASRDSSAPGRRHYGQRRCSRLNDGTPSTSWCEDLTVAHHGPPPNRIGRANTLRSVCSSGESRLEPNAPNSANSVGTLTGSCSRSRGPPSCRTRFRKATCVHLPSANICMPSRGGRVSRPENLDFFTDNALVDDPYDYYDAIRGCPVWHEPAVWLWCPGTTRPSRCNATPTRLYRYAI